MSLNFTEMLTILDCDIIREQFDNDRKVEGLASWVPEEAPVWLKICVSCCRLLTGIFSIVNLI